MIPLHPQHKPRWYSSTRQAWEISGIASPNGVAQFYCWGGPRKPVIVLMRVMADFPSLMNGST